MYLHRCMKKVSSLPDINFVLKSRSRSRNQCRVISADNFEANSDDEHGQTGLGHAPSAGITPTIVSASDIQPPKRNYH